MLHSSSGGRSPLQLPPLSLLLVSLLQLWAPAPGPGSVQPSAPPVGPQGARRSHRHVPRGGEQPRGPAVLTERICGRMLPGLFCNGPTNAQDAWDRRAVSGCQTEAPRAGNQVWGGFYLLQPGAQQLLQVHQMLQGSAHLMQLLFFYFFICYWEWFKTKCHGSKLPIRCSPLRTAWRFTCAGRTAGRGRSSAGSAGKPSATQWAWISTEQFTPRYLVNFILKSM